MEKVKILVVDDEQGILHAIRRVLRREPYQVVVTDNPQEALSLLEGEEFGLIISDQRMPAMEGIELLEQARQLTPETVRMILTGYMDIQAAIAAINQGAVFRFIAKPWNDEELRQHVHQGIAQYQLVRENRRLHELTLRQNEELEEVHGETLKIASRIQQALLLGEKAPEIRGVTVAGMAQPSHQVGGDFYELVKHSEDCLDVIVGDVMGKGIPAALLGAATKHQFLKAMNYTDGSGNWTENARLGQIVDRVHNQMTQKLIALDSFVTVCYARFDLESRRLYLVDCGHTKTIHYQRAADRCQALQGDNLPLGFRQDERYEQISAELEAGDILFFYSDGLTEARNKDGDLLGTERLSTLIRRHNQLDPEALIGAIRAAAELFAHPGNIEDDLTCVALRIH